MNVSILKSNLRNIFLISFSVEYAITVGTTEEGYTIKNIIDSANFGNTVSSAITENTDITDTVAVESTGQAEISSSSID